MDDPTATTTAPPPPRGADDDDNSRAPKRKRMHSKKAAVACEACQRRKSRCEVFSVAGKACHRCQVLGTECSLQADSTDAVVPDPPVPVPVTLAATSTSGTAGSTPTNTAVDFTAMVQRIDQRTAEVERIMRHLLDTKGGGAASALGLAPPTPLSSGDTFGDREDGVGDGDDIEQTVWELLQRSIGTSLQGMTGLNLHDRTRFHDPILSGLVSESGFNDVCIRFTSLVRRTLPIDELLPNIPLLAQPFLRCAILHYMSFTRSSSPEDVDAHARIEQLTHANLQLVPLANPSPATLIGLLILCVCPANGFETRFLRTYAAHGVVAHAAAVGHGLGLQDAADRAHQESERDLVGSECFRPLLLQVALFYTLTHQTAWSDIYSSPSLSCRQAVTYPLSAILSLAQIRKLRSPLLVHLHYESKLLAQVALVSAAFQRVRTASIFDASRLMVLWHQMDQFEAAVRRWRTEVAEEELLESKDFLILNSLFLHFLMCLKLSTDAGTLLPSPLILEDRVPFRMAHADGMMARAEELVEFITSSKLDLSLVPSFYLTLSFIPFKALPNAAIIDPRRLPFVQSEAFGRFRNILLGAHPLSAGMVEKIDQSVPHMGWKMLFEDVRGGGEDAAGEEYVEVTPETDKVVPPQRQPATNEPVGTDDEIHQWWAFEDVTAVVQFDDV